LSNFTTIIKNYFLARGWIRVGLGFVGFGVSIFFPDFWEFIIGTLLLNMDLEGASELSYTQIIFASVLISIGVTVLIWVFINERKKRFIQFDLTRNDHGWVFWDQNKKNSKDPEYIFEIPLSIKTGIESVMITKLYGIRYVFGCECLMRKAILKDRDSNSTVEYLDEQSIKNGLLIAPYQVKNIVYRRGGRGPRIGFICEQLESAQYKIKIEYQFSNRPESLSKNLFIDQNNGQLKFIKSLDPPPFLNNSILNRAVKEKIISESEREGLMSINEDERMLLIKLGEPYVKRSIDLHEAHLKLCREIHSRIYQKDHPEFKKLKMG